MIIKIVTEPITKAEALSIAQEFYGDMVKGVVDIEREVIALGGEYHMDANNVLIEKGSKQAEVWGFNIYPGLEGGDWIEYVSLINIRPQIGNRSMVVEDKKIRDIMRNIIEKLVK